MKARLGTLQKFTNGCHTFQWWLVVQEHKEWEGKSGILPFIDMDLPKICQRGFFYCMIQ